MDDKDVVNEVVIDVLKDVVPVLDTVEDAVLLMIQDSISFV